MVFDLPRFESEPVLGIVRGLNESCLEGVVDAAFAGGLRFLEITLNTPEAFHLINNIIFFILIILFWISNSFKWIYYT